MLKASWGGGGRGMRVIESEAELGPQMESARREAAGTQAEEASALQLALSQALAEVEALAGRATGEAADMLGFQVAMLSDEELVRPALEGVGAGESAAAAWEAAMEVEIAGYRDARDDHFSARTADLEDIRDRVLGHLEPGGTGPVIPDGSVVVAADLPISRFLAIDWARGGAILLTQGSSTSHVAMLARARGVPMVVGLVGAANAMAGREALVDAATGEVVLDPTEATLAIFAAKADREMTAAAASATFRLRPAVTRDGTRIALNLNTSSAHELEGLDPAICDGIGLVRTEILFHGPGALPDENAQYEAYRRIVAWADGRPVTIRTLDAGGDKPIPGVTVDGESNPFLGLRGIRLSLRHPALFQIQLRALARAAAHGDVRIMLPMVTVPAELEAGRKLLGEALASLARDNLRRRFLFDRLQRPDSVRDRRRPGHRNRSRSCRPDEPRGAATDRIGRPAWTGDGSRGESLRRRGRGRESDRRAAARRVDRDRAAGRRSAPEPALQPDPNPNADALASRDVKFLL